MFTSKNSEHCSNLEMNFLNKLKMPAFEDCCYTSCYCEENVWKLCEFVKDNQQDLMSTCFAVFISNKNQSVPLWYQRSGEQADKLAVWDYHVLFIYKPGSNCETMVYDLDTVLPFPVEFEKYVSLTFQYDKLLSPDHFRYFRVIPAKVFLETFATDRSRMKKPDGTWIKNPPPYPCITTRESSNNLEDFISMDPDRGVGEVMNLKGFIDQFS